jgi:hypothetical protein
MANRAIAAKDDPDGGQNRQSGKKANDKGAAVCRVKRTKEKRVPACAGPA